MGESKQKNTDVAGLRVINFMKQRFIAAIISAVLLIAAIISLAVNSLQFGLDFTGGLQIEAQYSEPADLNRVRQTLVDNGFKDAVVVNFGSDKELKITTQQDRFELANIQLANLVAEIAVENLTIQSVSAREDDRLPNGGLVIDIANGNNATAGLEQLLAEIDFTNYQLQSASGGLVSLLTADGIQVLTEKLLAKTLTASTDGDVLIKRTEFVGPQVGAELRDQGGIGLLFALGVVMVYVALRFQFKFSVGAVAALMHDVLVVLGFFSIFKLDFDLTVLAAILAVIGYSLNDTIVVSDRIRENFRKVRKGTSADVINLSLTQTLGRTLVTSLTTLLVLFALFFFGGELIRGFAIALIIGIVIGTYSSIYVAANILLAMNITKEDLMVPEKEGAELDDLP